MADKERFNLLHVPELKPERNYRSEATFQPPEPTPAVDTNVPIKPELPEIIEDLIVLEDLAGGLPDGLQPVEEIVNILRRRAEVIQQEVELLEEIGVPETVGSQPESVIPVEENIPDEIQIGSNISEYIPTMSGIPELFPPPSNVKINIETPKTLVQLTQDAYVKDQIDLQKHYLQNMRLLLQKYFQNQFALMGELGLSEMDLLTRDYNGDEVKGISSNSQHLHDTIIRSQIARKQKARYFSKVANTDQTLLHIRNWNAAEKLRERYYSEAYGESDTFTNSEANDILRQNRSEFDANYKRNLYNMYKYLDGSLKITEDILDHTLLESKAKAKLIKDGIDIFAQPNYSSGDGVQTTQAQIASENKQSSSDNTNSTTKPTAEEMDKAIGINDPASEAVYGLAPNGAHFSQNDINYLISSNPDYYGTSGQKAINVANTLALHSKYAAGSNDNTTSSNKSTGTTTVINSNKSSEATSTQVNNTSIQKVESVTASETEKKQTTQEKQEAEAQKIKDETIYIVH